MQKFKKKRLPILVGISLFLVSTANFNLKMKEENKLQESNRELLAMFVQDENGEYNANPSKEFPKEGYKLNLEKSTCKNGGILSQDNETKKIGLKIQKSDQCTLYFDKEIPTLKEYYDTVTKKTNVPIFANPATTDETEDGLFSMEDDYGMSYYFRGTAPNNYLKFGQDAIGQDMWWRIIRFNGDGTVRIIYDGAGPASSNTYKRGFALIDQAWNTNNNDAKYVGWMYGGMNGSASTSKEEAQRNETDSEIKIKVDEWYKTNIVDTGYGNFVADSIFCNDRSIPGKAETGWSSDTGLGYGTNKTGFGASSRTNVWNTDVSKIQPRFTCLQENDKFTVSISSGGNGALTYPVGLITADEVLAAGCGVLDTTNESYYLLKTKWNWTFSPAYMNNSLNGRIFRIGSFGFMNVWGVHYKGAVAPVINIKVEFLNQFKGTGTINNPYRIFNT